jgi:amino acid permease
MLSWMGVTVTHIRFRYGYIAQGYKLEDLPYVAPFFPWADYLSLLIGLFVTFAMIFQVANTPGDFDWINNSHLYVGLPVFFVLYFLSGLYATVNSQKEAFGDKLKDGFGLVPYHEMDFVTDRIVEMPEDKMDTEAFLGKPKTMKEWGKYLLYKLS